MSKFLREVLVPTGSNVVQIVPALQSDDLLVNVVPFGGADALVEFSLSDVFQNILVQLKEVQDLAGVVTDNTGDEFEFDPTDDSLDLTTLFAPGEQIRIRTATQAEVQVSVTSVTATVLTVQAGSGEGFTTEASASVSVVKGLDGESLNDPASAVWVPWTPGVVAVLTTAPVPAQVKAVRFTTTTAGAALYEIGGTRV